jgi:enoyl-CoA hydratase
VFDDASEHDAVRVVVLTGNGDVFSAGGDLERMKRRIDHPEEDPFLDSLREAESIIHDLLNLEKPVVAKVNGHATGLGATLALFCDLTYISADAKIGDPHVNVGLVAGDGGAVIWPLLTDMHTAKEFLMTGRLAPAEEAEEIGLVNEAVPPEELDERVESVVDRLATRPQTAVQFTKMALNGWIDLGVSKILKESLAYEAISQRDPDHDEAVTALLEDRDPEFPSARSEE